MPLVDTKEMFDKAYAGGYAIGAFNVNNMEIVQGIVAAAEETKSPVILQASAGARKYAGPEYLFGLVQSALKVSDVPIALHLDHGADFETCKSCIDGGFTSVMIDGSAHSFEANIAITKEVVEYAHAHGVVVEGELGQLEGIEDDVNVAQTVYTNPDDVEEFVARTGVDSLAIAIGTSHGAFKFRPEQCTRNAEGVLVPPDLRFDILDEITKRLPNFPIVLHGASSVVPKYVEIINHYGGNLKDAIGIPEDQLRKAARSAVCKINIDSDMRLALTAGIREHMAQHPEHFDPRQYLKPARQYIQDIVAHKIRNVLGSDGKAFED
jgi:fructose-bisphosphate aldolase class II